MVSALALSLAAARDGLIVFGECGDVAARRVDLSQATCRSHLSEGADERAKAAYADAAASVAGAAPGELDRVVEPVVAVARLMRFPAEKTFARQGGLVAASKVPCLEAGADDSTADVAQQAMVACGHALVAAPDDPVVQHKYAYWAQRSGEAARGCFTGTTAPRRREASPR